MNEVEHISVTINRPAAEVYEFAANARNLPRWASGLARSTIEQHGDAWLADSPMGKIRIKFAPRNPYGVLDHDVTVEGGATFHNPMRVVPHGGASVLSFTLFRQPGMSDQALAADKATIEKDLNKLKELLERHG